MLSLLEFQICRPRYQYYFYTKNGDQKRELLGGCFVIKQEDPDFSHPNILIPCISGGEMRQNITKWHNTRQTKKFNSEICLRNYKNEAWFQLPKHPHPMHQRRWDETKYYEMTQYKANKTKLNSEICLGNYKNEACFSHPNILIPCISGGEMRQNITRWHSTRQNKTKQKFNSEICLRNYKNEAWFQLPKHPHPMHQRRWDETKHYEMTQYKANKTKLNSEICLGNYKNEAWFQPPKHPHPMHKRRWDETKHYEMTQYKAKQNNKNLIRKSVSEITRMWPDFRTPKHPHPMHHRRWDETKHYEMTQYKAKQNKTKQLIRKSVSEITRMRPDFSNPNILIPCISGGEMRQNIIQDDTKQGKTKYNGNLTPNIQEQWGPSPATTSSSSSSSSSSHASVEMSWDKT